MTFWGAIWYAVARTRVRAHVRVPTGVTKRDETRTVDGVTEPGICLWCGTLFERAATGRPRKYCKHGCRQRAYESRIWGVPELRARWAVEYADCYICGEPLDWAKPDTICGDHQIATVYAGRTVPENVKPVHVPCNLHKGARFIISLADLEKTA